MDPEKTSEQNDAVKIKISSHIGKKAPVFITDFSCGRLNSNTMRFQCYKSQDDSEIKNQTAKRMLVANNGRLTYTGSTSENIRNAPLRYYVGLRNKRTGKMKLYDSVFFHLKPNLKAPAEISKKEPSPVKKNYWDERNKLTAAFGGKTQKRSLSAQLKFAVSADSLEGTLNVDSPPASPVSTAVLTGSPHPETMSYLPSVNRKATSVEEVFDINNIISPVEDSALEEQAETWLALYQEDPATAIENFCTFTRCQLKREVTDPAKVKYMLYYNYLVIFSHLTAADIRKKEPAPLIPEPFKRIMVDKFTCVTKTDTGRQSRTLPQQMRDKLTAFIIVLALFINNHSADVGEVMVDLKRVAQKQFNLIAKTLGCHITKQQVDGELVQAIELKLPLNFVPPKFSKRQF